MQLPPRQPRPLGHLQPPALMLQPCLSVPPDTFWPLPSLTLGSTDGSNLSGTYQACSGCQGATDESCRHLPRPPGHPCENRWLSCLLVHQKPVSGRNAPGLLRTRPLPSGTLRMANGPADLTQCNGKGRGGIWGRAPFSPETQMHAVPPQ